MLLKSKFTFRILYALGLLVGIAGFIIWIVLVWKRKKFEYSGAVVAFLAVFGTTWLIVFFYDVRKNITRVKITSDRITASGYLGLGFRRSYPIIAFDGFKTKKIMVRYDFYEFLYLVVKGKKVITISEYYHSNYAAMKKALRSSLPYLNKPNAH